MWKKIGRQSVSTLFLMVALVLTLCISTQPAWSAPTSYPTKRIELIVPFAPGGITDLTARGLASVLPEFLGQPVVVINKAGGARFEGGDLVAKSKPDGYTIGIFNTPLSWPEQHFNDTSYKSEDLVAVCRVVAAREVIIVPADSKYKTLDDLVKAMKADPALKVQFGITGLGTLPHLVAAAFADQLGMSDRIVAVPLEGDAGVVRMLLGAHVPFGVGTLTGVFTQYKAGTIKLLAITGQGRADEAPEVPNLIDLGFNLGLPSAENVIRVPKGTPLEVIRVLDAAVAKSCQHPNFKAIASKAAIPVSYIPRDEYVKTEAARRKVLGDLMIKLGLVKGR